MSLGFSPHAMSCTQRRLLKVWDKVDCNYIAVPSDLVPVAIAEYVKTNFAGTKIVKIDKEHGGYEVELSNDIELHFNSQGKLMYFDD